MEMAFELNLKLTMQDTFIRIIKFYELCLK